MKTKDGIIHLTRREILIYQVIVNYEVVFEDACRAICNGYIFRHQLMGIRPTPVYIEE